jgi:hypothetical protein
MNHMNIIIFNINIGFTWNSLYIYQPRISRLIFHGHLLMGAFELILNEFDLILNAIYSISADTNVHDLVFNKTAMPASIIP